MNLAFYEVHNATSATLHVDPLYGSGLDLTTAVILSLSVKLLLRVPLTVIEFAPVTVERPRGLTGMRSRTQQVERSRQVLSIIAPISRHRTSVLKGNDSRATDYTYCPTFSG